MVKIVTLQEFPNAAKFCSNYIENSWGYNHEMPLIPTTNSKLSSAQPESPKDFFGSLLHEAAGLSTTGSRIHCHMRMAVFNESKDKEAAGIVNTCLHSKEMPFILVAKEGKSLIGTIMASEENDDVTKKYSPWLLLLYVKKDFQNKGIGTKLIKTACKNLKNLGYSKAYIDTNTAHDLFKNIGL